MSLTRTPTATVPNPTCCNVEGHLCAKCRAVAGLPAASASYFGAAARNARDFDPDDYPTPMTINWDDDAAGPYPNGEASPQSGYVGNARVLNADDGDYPLPPNTMEVLANEARAELDQQRRQPERGATANAADDLSDCPIPPTWEW